LAPERELQKERALEGPKVQYQEGFPLKSGSSPSQRRREEKNGELKEGKVLPRKRANKGLTPSVPLRKTPRNAVFKSGL